MNRMGDKFMNYSLPSSIEEAYEILMSKKRASRLVGGGCFIKMSDRRIGLAVDLSQAGLDYINDLEDEIEIGAMTTLRSMETSQLLKDNFGPILEDSVKNIIGVQLRNIAAIGGTVFSKFGFSDPITALLALDADIVLYDGGRMSLESFLKEEEIRKDILEKIILKKNVEAAAFQSMRNSRVDYAILNAAVAKIHGKYRIAVGARPKTASLAYKAMDLLNEKGLTEETIEQASKLVVEELDFGTNTRGSAQYREELAKVLTKRALGEVE